MRQAKATAKMRKLFDGRGLYLLITPTGGRGWRFKYRFGGKERLLSFGTYPEITLAEARSRCEAARRLVAQGLDPSEQRKSERAARQQAQALERNTFKAVAREWFEKFRPTWVPAHAENIIARLEKDVLPWIGNRPVAEITAVELLEVLRRVESRGALEVAHRLKQIMGQVFRFAISTARASRDPTRDLQGALPPRRPKHHAAVTSPTEVAQLLRAIRGYRGSFIVASALKLAPLVFVRPGELRHMEWSEVDFTHALWRIPATKMKMRAEHLVPLSPEALNILHQIQPLTGESRYVFPSARSSSRAMSENALTGALRRLDYEAGTMTSHGFRSLASTMLNELGWPGDVIERQLAHGEKDEVRGAYNRAQHLIERRKMMVEWANYLDRLAAGGEVIPFHRAD